MGLLRNWSEVKLMDALLKADPDGTQALTVAEVRAARGKRNNKPQTLRSTERLLAALLEEGLVSVEEGEEPRYRHDAEASRAFVLEQRRLQSALAIARKRQGTQTGPTSPYKRQRLSPLGS